MSLDGRLCQELCSRWLRSGLPSPFDTVLSMDKYASTVSLNGEEGMPTVVWDTDRQSMTVRGRSIKLENIATFYRGLLENIKGIMSHLAQGTSLSIPIPFSGIVDDLQNRTPHYSFLGFDNPKIAEMRYRVLASFRTSEWFVAKPEGGFEWNRSHLSSWMEGASELNRLFLMAIHIGGGQPARGTEILSVLIRNRQNGQRGLFALAGGLATVIGYNKVSFTIQLAGKMTEAFGLPHRPTPRPKGGSSSLVSCMPHYQTSYFNTWYSSGQ